MIIVVINAIDTLQFGKQWETTTLFFPWKDLNQLVIVVNKNIVCRLPSSFWLIMPLHCISLQFNTPKILPMEELLSLSGNGLLWWTFYVIHMIILIKVFLNKLFATCFTISGNKQQTTVELYNCKGYIRLFYKYPE